VGRTQAAGSNVNSHGVIRSGGLLGSWPSAGARMGANVHSLLAPCDVVGQRHRAHWMTVARLPTAFCNPRGPWTRRMVVLPVGSCCSNCATPTRRHWPRLVRRFSRHSSRIPRPANRISTRPEPKTCAARTAKALATVCNRCGFESHDPLARSEERNVRIVALRSDYSNEYAIQHSRVRIGRRGGQDPNSADWRWPACRPGLA
jgi:hypothetical protein